MPFFLPIAYSHPFQLRRSPVHGTGVFATRPIVKGARLIEYVGERISHREAERRHARKKEGDGHTFLFTVSERTVIDAGVDGNEARFINHSCTPNCEMVLERGRLYAETIRAIAPGEELAYDYNIGRDDDDPPDVEKVFACRCGTLKCRGNMLEPPKRRRRQKRR